MFSIREYVHQLAWDKICLIHDKARIVELEGSASLDAFIPLKECYKDEELFNSKVYVGLISNHVVGFVAYDKNDITWLYVNPSSHKRGYGKKLLRYVLQKVQGDPTVTVLDNNFRALNLYTSLGFKIIKEKVGKISGTNYPAVGYKMKKTL